jgi:hypothetical protein
MRGLGAAAGHPAGSREHAEAESGRAGPRTAAGQDALRGAPAARATPWGVPGRRAHRLRRGHRRARGAAATRLGRRLGPAPGRLARAPPRPRHPAAEARGRRPRARAAAVARRYAPLGAAPGAAGAPGGPRGAACTRRAPGPAGRPGAVMLLRPHMTRGRGPSPRSPRAPVGPLASHDHQLSPPRPLGAPGRHGQRGGPPQSPGLRPCNGPGRQQSPLPATHAGPARELMVWWWRKPPVWV